MISRRGLVVFGLGAMVADALAACSLSIHTQPSPLLPAAPKPEVANPAVGIIGDGVANDGPALQVMLNSAAATGASVTLVANSRLRIASTVFVPSNTRFDGNGATLINDSANDGHIFRLVKVENVTISNVIFDGRGSGSQATEQRHNVSLAGVRNVRIERIRSSNARGDGLYIGDHLNGPSVKVSLADSDFDRNHRQGMSVTCVSGLTVKNCSFRNTAGTSPQAGVDIEPNTDTSVIDGLEFYECNFTGNAGGGLVVSLRDSPAVTQASGIYSRCRFNGNGRSHGVLLRNSRRARFIGGQMNENGRNGLVIFAAAGSLASSSDTSLDGVHVARNGLAGVKIAHSFKRFLLANCVLERNGIESSGYSCGLDSLLAVGSRGQGLTVIDNSFSEVKIGLRTSGSCSRVTIAGNHYASVMTAKSLGDDPRTRVDFEVTPHS